MLQLHRGARSRREEYELIWWPPELVLELACLAVDSGGDPATIHRVLDPTIIAVSFVLYFFSCSFYLRECPCIHPSPTVSERDKSVTRPFHWPPA
jgi:hypothetical protein